tara:strand:+ start:434 stop:640 length:207 start_codon:yes stop_codon:yes gene_type:complete
MDREKYLIDKYEGLKTETLEKWLKEKKKVMSRYDESEKISCGCYHYKKWDSDLITKELEKRKNEIKTN